MKVRLYGAAGEVTGSAYEVQTENGNLLVDFGMFQGGRMAEARNRVPSTLNISKLKAVLVTHAHLDHVGRLPLLVKAGYDGPIYATPATIDLTELILYDAAKIQRYDNERWNRKRKKQGLQPVEPLFDEEDVADVLRLMQPVKYDTSMEIIPGVKAEFHLAGHLLGSTSIELLVSESGQRLRRVVFSGDLGPNGSLILRDSKPFDCANLVFLESTYGNRMHRPLDDTVREFEAIVKNVYERGGKMLVPTFAVGRAQLMLFLLARMFRNGVVPKFPVYLDSPMAVRATEIFSKYQDLMDEEVQEMISDHPIQEDLSSLKMVVSAKESMALNEQEGPCMIMAGAGMCNAGRILHHLKWNLPSPNTAVVVVGYQADGSLGRQLVDGPPREVSIFGKRVQVNASVHSLGGFSAHADQAGLLKWLDHMADCKPDVVLTHGENKARMPLAEIIQERYNTVPQLPGFEDVID